MAQLPNVNRAFIHPAKVQDYLLNPEHPVGGSKADYFLAFGFSVEQWEVFRDALREHARTAEIVEIRQKKHGIAYALRDELTTPDGRNPVILSIWQIDLGQEVPRFITAYPDD